MLQVWLLQASTGQSIGQRLTRTRIVALGGGRPSPWWLLLRIALLIFPPFVLGLVVDADGRGAAGQGGRHRRTQLVRHLGSRRGSS